MALTVKDMKGRKIGICVSGGLDSRTIATRLREAGAEVLCFTADLGQPDEKDIRDVRKKMAPCGVDTVIVAMGSSLDSSIMCVMVAKELGVRHVIAKAASLRMGEILRRVGADEIIYPEKESAEMTARRLLSSDFLEYFDLGDELCVFSMRPKKEWIGKTLRELKLRDRYQLNIMAIRENGRTSATMNPDLVLTENAEIFAVAERKALDHILH